MQGRFKFFFRIHLGVYTPILKMFIFLKDVLFLREIKKSFFYDVKYRTNISMTINAIRYL